MCSICQGLVPAGEGVLHREGTGWGVTHADACPRGLSDNGSIRHGHAQAYARRVMALLRRPNATIDDIEEAVRGMVALLRTGWVKQATCERILLNSKALEGRDRLEAEGFLHQLLPEESESHA